MYKVKYNCNMPLDQEGHTGVVWGGLSEYKHLVSFVYDCCLAISIFRQQPGRTQPGH